MRTALLLGSIGAVLIASPKRRKAGPVEEYVEPDVDIHSPIPGTLFVPMSSMHLDDNSPYCLSFSVLSRCADRLQRSNRISPKKARSLPGNRMFRQQLCKLIISSPFNDVLYGEHKGRNGNTARGPLGSTISITPKHADNLSLMRQGKPLKRTIDRSGRVVDHAAAHRLPMLWIPYICLESLAQGHVTTGSYEYEDGSSTIVPPPPIMGLV